MPWLKINYDNALPAFEEVQMPDDDSSMAFLDACYVCVRDGKNIVPMCSADAARLRSFF